MALGKNLEQKLAEKNIIQADLIRLMHKLRPDIPYENLQVSVSNTIKRDSKSSRYLSLVCEALHITTDELLNRKVEQEPVAYFSRARVTPSPLNNVRLLNYVQAGAFSEMLDHYSDEDIFIETTYRVRKYTFALKVHGPSMEPKFPQGCTIIVEPEEQAKNGSFVIVRQNGDKEATFKQLIQDGEKFYLKALNPHWPEPIIEMLPDAVIIGVVKKIEMDV